MLALAASYGVIDSHTAGHPTRVIFSGLPRLAGRTAREKRDWFKTHHDALRPSLLHEPAGHAAMVGLVPVPSDVADFGAFFISSYIYLDMCGHATIGYAKTLAATGSIAAPLEKFTLETPAGVVCVYLQWAPDAALASVRLRNVKSYAGAQALIIDAEGVGPLRVDMAYGGIWYAVVDADRIGLELDVHNVSTALRWGSAIKSAVSRAVQELPADLGGGAAPSVLFTSTIGRLHGKHLVVLESNKFDRSPCGTGTSAWVALLAKQGRMAEGDVYTAENLLGIAFTARIAAGADGAVIPEIEGCAYITAYSTLVKECLDPVRGGFLCH
jgi:proline racemase